MLKDIPGKDKQGKYIELDVVYPHYTTLHNAYNMYYRTTSLLQTYYCITEINLTTTLKPAKI
jgi:hypothetical protein